MTAGLRTDRGGRTYADCPDCAWTGPHRDTRPDAFDDATTHNLTHHMPAWFDDPKEHTA